VGGLEVKWKSGGDKSEIFKNLRSWRRAWWRGGGGGWVDVRSGHGWGGGLIVVAWEWVGCWCDKGCRWSVKWAEWVLWSYTMSYRCYVQC